jgi:hypothetical protein
MTTIRPWDGVDRADGLSARAHGDIVRDGGVLDDEAGATRSIRHGNDFAPGVTDCERRCHRLTCDFDAVSVHNVERRQSHDARQLARHPFR